MTVEDYLAFDLAHVGKHELVNGELWAMAGASIAHNLVAANLTIALGLRLRGSSCRIYSSDQRVLIDETGLYCYPDLTVVCGRPETVPTPLSTKTPSSRTTRSEAGWLLTEAQGEGVLALPELNLDLPLAELFDGLDEALAAEAAPPR